MSSNSNEPKCGLCKKPLYDGHYHYPEEFEKAKIEVTHNDNSS